MHYDFLEERVLPNGMEYHVYMPEKIDANTKIIMYEHGAGGYGINYQSLNNSIAENGSNSIIVYYNRSQIPERGIISDQMDIIKAISAETGVSPTNVAGVGHSAGAPYTLATAAEIIKSNPNTPPQSIMLLDGSFIESKANGLTEDVLKTLGQNDTVLYAVMPANCDRRSMIELYKKWSKEYGINIVILRDKNATTGNGGIDHALANNNYAKNGLLEFQEGNATFPPGLYDSFVIQDGEMKDIEIAGKTNADVHKYLGISPLKSLLYDLALLKNIPTSGVYPLINGSTVSDTVVMNNYLNNIIGSIKSCSLVTNGYNENQSFLSTTKVPCQISSIANEYFTMKATLLQKIANDMYEFAKIAEKNQILDMHMANVVDSMNSSIETMSLPE